MGSASFTGKILRFGPFELDPETQQLRRAGAILRIQPQPFKVLSLLASRAGAVVSREELQQELWGQETFVDFEQGLNYCIRQIRAVLGDEASTPRYVETVPRRGYRFIAAVEGVVENRLPISGQDAAAESKAVIPRAWLGVAAAVAILLLLAGTVYVVKVQSRRQLTAKDTAVLADFTNHTGDPVFDDTLKTALSVALDQSPFLNILSDDKVNATLQMMLRPVNTKLTPDVASELCQRTGSKAYITGSIDSLGGKYVLGLKATSCQNGDVLSQAQVSAATKEKVLQALGIAASKLRSELGESLATVQKFDVPLAQATTSSLEALKAYSLAEEALDEKDPATALPNFQRAIQLDPNFALAYMQLGVTYFSLNELGRASEYYAKAFQLREHTSEWEKLAITATYYEHVTGELNKAALTLQEEIEIYPRAGGTGGYNGLGLTYAQQGLYEKAIEATRPILQFDPGYKYAYANLANYSLALEHLDDARQIINQAHARKLDDYMMHNTIYAGAFLRADLAGMEEQQQWFVRQPEYENYGLALAADTEASSGHVGRARELTRRAVESAIRTDNKEGAAIYQANAALQEAAYGDPLPAERSATDALRLAPGSPGVAAEAALAFAMAGKTARAESLAQDLAKRFPLDTQMQSLWLPAVRAQLALDRKDPASALNALRDSSPMELASIQFLNNLSCLHTVYVRGEAYLAAEKGDAAAAEFQRILDHNGIVWNCWTGALARLGVARAKALQGRTSEGADADAARVRALAAYKEFLTLWKDADPDIPILKQAKAEYAKLQ
jgi:eukaryotic-like serine/threonine-protein kinase